MLKNSELRAGDVLQFIDFGNQYLGELEKLKKFIVKFQGEEYCKYLTRQLDTQEKLENCRGEWTGFADTTAKTKTEFVTVKLHFPNDNKINFGIQFGIQTRYLKIVDRKSNHLFTKMFLH